MESAEFMSDHTVWCQPSMSVRSYVCEPKKSRCACTRFAGRRPRRYESKYASEPDMDGVATPALTARVMTRRHDSLRATSSLANSPSTNSEGSAASLSYACLMRSRKRARMMHPPFQMRAISPRSRSQPCSTDLARIRFMPCAYEQILEAYSAARTSSTSACFSSALSAGFAASAGARPAATYTFSAATRSSLRPERKRASSEDATVGIATESSAACCTVHFPVPFMPVLSRILSTSAPPFVFWSSCFAKIKAEISMRNESSSAWFHSVNADASSSLVKPPTTRSTSYASEMSCMSPYSMPLCTIFTKLPAPPGPTYVTQGPLSVCAHTFLTTSSMLSNAARSPPGIIAGPLRAPSSPPLTPIPRYRRPFAAASFCLLSVFSYHSFPPSMMMSPGSMCSLKPAIVASTGAPAFTKMITVRGF
mmetsp:Transcript_473/g.1942  ORF Transcript_473/g.1942 Transcript_473/m.1942 type:complete len:422 (-) Transcript_473:421-1686(-)